MAEIEALLEHTATPYQRERERLENGPEFDTYELGLLRKYNDLSMRKAALENLTTRTTQQEDELHEIVTVLMPRYNNLNTRKEELENQGTLSSAEEIELHLINSIKEKQENWERDREAGLLLAPPEENFERDTRNTDGQHLWLSERPWDIDRADITYEPPVSLEQIRLYLSLIMRPPLRRFFEEQCVLRFMSEPQNEPGFPPVGQPNPDLHSPTHTGGITVSRETYDEETGDDRFVLKCDTLTFMRATAEGARYLDLNQFGFTFIKTLLQLVPKDEEKWAKLQEELSGKKSALHENIVPGQQESEAAIDYLALAAVDQERADSLSSEAAMIANQIYTSLERLDRREFATNANAVLNNFNGQLWQQRMILSEKLQKEEQEAVLAGHKFVRGINKLSDWILGRVNLKLQLNWNGFYMTDWYERAKAELDDKEAGRILKRDVHVTIREKEFRQAIALGDRDSARWLLLADSSTSDYMSWRMYLYLYHFDERYRKTNAQEITAESFDLLMRLHRISYKAKMLGTKPGEYTLAKDGTYAKLISYDDQVRNAFEELSKFSARNVMGLADETWEWLKYLKDGEFIEWDDVLGEGDPNDPHYWALPTADLRDVTTDPEGFLEFMRNARKVTGDKKFGTKLNPQQRAVLAYCHHMAMTEKGFPTHEHSPPAAGAATAWFGNHRPKESFDWDKFKKNTEFVARLDAIHEASPYKNQDLLRKLFNELESGEKEAGFGVGYVSRYTDNYAGVSTEEIRKDFRKSSDKIAKLNKRPEVQDVQAAFVDTASEYENLSAMKELEEFIKTILPEDKKSYKDPEELETLSSEVIKRIRENAPHWYRENQFEVQKYVKALAARVPELRAATKAQEKIDPYIKGPATFFNPDHGKTLDKMIKRAEAAFHTQKAIPPKEKLKLDPTIAKELTKTGFDVSGFKDLMGKDMLNEDDLNNFKAKAEEAVKLLSLETLKSDADNVYGLMVNAWKIVEGRPLAQGEKDFEGLRSDYLALPYKAEKDTEDTITDPTTLIEALKLTRFGLQQQFQEILKKQKEEEDKKKPKEEPKDETIDEGD